MCERLVRREREADLKWKLEAPVSAGGNVFALCESKEVTMCHERHHMPRKALARALRKLFL